MKFLFILIFLLLNFIIFRFIQRNETLKSKVIFILSLIIFNIVFTKSYKFLYGKYANYLLIKPFGLFVLLSFSCLIPIIVYLNKLTSTRLQSRLEDNDNESLMEYFVIFEKDSYLKIITIIVTFLQILFLWSGIVNLFNPKKNLETYEKQKIETLKIEKQKSENLTVKNRNLVTKITIT